MEIGIALSGGGARGLAHIGVLHGLNELGIYPVHVSGSSAGALIGVLYASGMDPMQIYYLSKDRSFSKIFRLGFTSLGLTDHSFLRELLMEHLGDIGFKDLEIPIYVGVTNIDSGQFEILEDGPIIPAIIASCSIPMLFRPVEINGFNYLDGGIMNNLPVEPLIGKCDKIIGSCVHQHIYRHKVDGIRDIGIRSFQLGIWNTMAERMKQCDIALDVTAAADIGMFELDRYKDLFEIGKEAVSAHSKEFIALLNGDQDSKKVLS